MKAIKLIASLLLAASISTTAFAQSYIYLKDDVGVLHGIIRYEPSFVNKYIKTNIVCLSKKLEGIKCEYVADSSPVAKEPAQTLQVSVDTPSQNVDGLKRSIAELDGRVKKVEQRNNIPTPTSQLQQTQTSTEVQNSPSTTQVPIVTTLPATPATPPTAQVVYQVIERAVPGPQGPAGRDGENGRDGSSYSQPILSLPAGAQFNGTNDPNTAVKGTAANFTDLSVSTLGGAGLSACNSSSDKLVYNASTKLFECGSDQVGSGGSLLAQTVTATSSITTPSLYASNTFATTSSVNNLLAGSATVTNATITNLSISGSISAPGFSGSNLNVTNATLTSASSTTFFSSLLTALSAIFTNLTSTNATFTNATTTNLSVSATTTTTGLSAVFASITQAIIGTLWGTTGNFQIINASTTNATTTNAAFANLVDLIGTRATLTSATVTNLVATVASLGTASTTNLTGTNATFTNATVTTLRASGGQVTLSNATITSATITNLTVSGTLTTTQPAAFSATSTFATTTAASSSITFLNAQNANITNLVGGQATLTSATATNLFATNASITGATSTSFFTAFLTALSAVFTSLVSTNATITNATSTTLFSDLGRFTDAIVGNLLATKATITNATTTTLAAGSASLLNASTSYLTTSNATLTNATITGSVSLPLAQGNFFVGNSGNNSAATSTIYLSTAGLLGLGTTAPGANIQINQGNLTGAAQGGLIISGAWNNGGSIFKGIEVDITNTSSHSSSNLLNLALGGSSVFRVSPTAGTIITSDLGVTGTTTVNKGINMSSNKIINLALPTNTTDAANKAYVDAMAQGVFYKAPVHSISTALIGASTTGDRYIVGAGSAGTGCALHQIAQNTGVGTWSCETPTTGASLFVDNGIDTTYNYNGTSWVSLGSTVNHANLIGLQGGTAGEYYHLNSSQYGDLNSVNAQLRQLQTTGTATQFVNLTLTGGLNISGANAGATITNATFTNIAVINNSVINLATVTDLFATRASVTSASTTNFFSSFLTAISAIFTNLTTTNLVAANSTTTAATSTSAYISSLLSAATANITTLFASTGTVTNLTSTSATLTNATSTNLYVSGTANFATAPAIPLTNGYVWRGSTGGQQEATSTLFIANDGNVGIGTTTPYATLSVSGTGYISGNAGIGIAAANLSGSHKALTVNASNAADYSALELASGGALNFYMNANNSGTYLNSQGTRPLILYTNSAERLRIDSSGNVGIGTTTPSAKLHVYNGNVTTSGNATNGLVSSSVGGIVTAFGSSDVYPAGFVNVTTAHPLQLMTNDAARLTIDASGNVGIGTSAPQTLLQIASASNQPIHISGTNGSQRLELGYDSTSNYGRIQAIYNGVGFQPLSLNPGGGRVGIGTTTPGSLLSVGAFGSGLVQNNTLLIGNNNPQAIGVVGNSTDSNINFYLNGTTTRFALLKAAAPVGGTSGGSFYVYTSDISGVEQERFELNQSGNLQLNAYGAGTLTTDASGNVTASSDERLKNIDSDFTRGLDDLVKLNPANYHWNATSGMETTNSYTGFIAQNVQSAIPEAVATDTRGYLTLSDRPILATVVNALKEIANISGTFKTNLVAWLASAQNGIESIVSNQIHTRLLCIGSVCFNESQAGQLQGLIGGAPVASPSIPDTGSATTSEPTWETGTTANVVVPTDIASDTDVTASTTPILPPRTIAPEGGAANDNQPQTVHENGIVEPVTGTDGL